jgi:hypothetical protein
VPFTRNISVPRFLKTDGFVLRLITAADAELDYAAVMESREYLRRWEQSTWPEDDFTVARNREDLEKLEKWNAEHLAFTYTVLDPSETECLGCVYIFPTNASVFQKSQITPVGRTSWDEGEAAVYFWVRKSRLKSHQDEVLLKALRHWIDSDWDLSGHVFVTNEQFEQQVQLLEGTDLRLRFEIKEDGKPGKYLAYA